MEEIKLNLGFGDKLRKGYRNVYLAEDRVSVKRDVKFSLRNPSVLESDYAHEIVAVQVVGHFWR